MYSELYFDGAHSSTFVQSKQNIINLQNFANNSSHTQQQPKCMVGRHKIDSLFCRNVSVRLLLLCRAVFSLGLSLAVGLAATRAPVQLAQLDS